MKKEKESKLENEQGPSGLEQFLQQKKEENKALQKLLNALQKEEKNGLDNKQQIYLKESDNIINQ